MMITIINNNKKNKIKIMLIIMHIQSYIYIIYYNIMIIIREINLNTYATWNSETAWAHKPGRLTTISHDSQPEP